MAATSLSYSRLKEEQPSSASGSAGDILLIDSNPRSAQNVATLLHSSMHRLAICSSAFEAIARMQKGYRPDVVIIDSLPDGQGLENLASIKSAHPNLRCIILSWSDDPKRVAQAMRHGAYDCVVKPLRGSDLQEALAECMSPSHHLTTTGCREQELPLEDNNSFVFASKKMWEIRAQCALVARVDLPVLILGESGTGKEVLAQFIHKTSPRAHRTFLKVNCAAMPAELLESELFGFEQGAFTGANRSKPGKFELCNHGTILLDEIGEMPASMQAKLLQVLQDGSFSRLGSRTTIKVDVRVIAATNIDIRAAIAQKKFREDLYYRLNGFSMTLPPLRERKEEVPLLFRYFLRKLSDKYATEPLTPSDRLIQACLNHSWPGNLRELENFVKRYLVLGDEHMMLNELNGHEGLSPVNSAVPVLTAHDGLKKLVRGIKGEAEMQAIAVALSNSGWNRKHAATELKISYKALLYKIRQYGLQPPDPVRN